MNNYAIPITIMVMVMLGFFVTFLKSHISSKQKLTLGDIAEWESVFEPSDDIKSAVNQWVGEHPGASFEEFYTFARNICRDKERQLLLDTYPNASKL